MSKSKKKAPRKKEYSGKKDIPVWGFWFAFNFVKGDSAHAGLTEGEITAYYRKYLTKWDDDNNPPKRHLFRPNWSTLSGDPETHHLIGEISPPPVEIPHPPPSGGTTTPPAPPPPPPPSLS